MLGRSLTGLLLAAASLLPLTATAPAATATATATAEACSLQSTNGTVIRDLGRRSYRLHVPAGLSGTSVPLLVSMHGWLSNPGAQESESGWSGFADSRKFIVAYPKSRSDLGLFPRWVADQGSPDVAFIKNVVADISATWCVDRARVYADGHSNGATMSSRMACDAEDTFAAIVYYSTLRTSPCTLSRPIAVGAFHGEADETIALSTGEAARDDWIARNGCRTTPVSEPVSDGTRQRFTGCNGGVEVLWRTYPGQGHSWPDGARGQDMRETMWTFLQAHPMP